MFSTFDVKNVDRPLVGNTFYNTCHPAGLPIFNTYLYQGWTNFRYKQYETVDFDILKSMYWYGNSEFFTNLHLPKNARLLQVFLG